MNKCSSKQYCKFIFSSVSVLLILTVLVSMLPYAALQAVADSKDDPRTAEDQQTGFADIWAYQQYRWNGILDAVFGDSIGHVTGRDYNGIPVPTKDEVMSNSVQVKEGNAYFNWHSFPDDSSVEPWNGIQFAASDITLTPRQIAALSNTSSLNYANGKTFSFKAENAIRSEVLYYDLDVATNGSTGAAISASKRQVKYTVIDVSDANELSFAMALASQGSNLGSSNLTNGIKINLLDDIDLNGAEYTWISKDIQQSGKSWLYIEGNGYTIYNMKCCGEGSYSASFLGNLNDGLNGRRVIIKNLNFSNCLVLHDSNLEKQSSTYSIAAVVVSCNKCRMYMENVNVKDSFVYSDTDQTGTLIARNDSSIGQTFIRNCSSQGCYVFGTNHTGGLTGCQQNTGTGYQVKYDAAFPASPESWLALNSVVYPEMVENCYSVDCELFSVGGDGDSGAFLSCGGKLICRNCFTNNIVYGNSKTGAFLGRIVTSNGGGSGLYDDNGSRRIAMYFENCFSSGSVEGSESIGGFVGYESGYNSSNYGVTVYKNCYTTAMVGMDFSGNKLGGLIGFENTSNLQQATINYDGKTYNNPGSFYINCYAAGEVGNILTDTSVTPEGEYKYIGGFLGEVGFSAMDTSALAKHASLNNGNYINCYYDKQTTAMRERACGRADCFNSVDDSQIPNVTGVYTQKSEKKEVQGLTDTVEMGDSVWNYDIADAYPMLNCFGADANANFGTLVGEYDSDTQIRIETQLSEKAETVKKYSIASVSTVLLDHWDFTMNMSDGTVYGDANGNGDLTAGLGGVLEQVTYSDTNTEEWEGSFDDKYWQIEFVNVKEGNYDLKINQGDSWAYNFGQDKFNSTLNCVLQMAQMGDVTIKFDYAPSVIEQGIKTPFKIWAEIKYKNSSTTEIVELGENKYTEITNYYTVAGSFTDQTWVSNAEEYRMILKNGTYQLTKQLTKGEYEFKITENGGWDVSYGIDGGSNNMNFTIDRDCSVTFNFDSNTKITTVTTVPEEALTEVHTVSHMDFKGYSIIAPTEITGHNWLDNEQAAIDGELEDPDGDGVYTKTFNVDATNLFSSQSSRIFGYKVIKDAADNGNNNYFQINQPNDPTVNSISVTFNYNPSTGEASVTETKYVTNEVKVNFYGILGSQELTGFDWETGVDNGNRASLMMNETDENIWTKTISDIPAGTHSFKVVADGTFSSGMSFGANDDNDNNYIFVTTDKSTVTITFNSETYFTVVTAVNARGDDVIYTESYVVSGVEALTGEEWNPKSEKNIMTYDPETAAFYKTYELSCDINQCYAFKITSGGVDNDRYNKTFMIKGNPGEAYLLKIIYNPTQNYNAEDINENPVCKLYEKDDDGNYTVDVSDYLTPPDFTHWSVLGDEGLTGASWVEFDDENHSTKMHWVEKNDIDNEDEELQDGWWETTFKNVKVDATLSAYGFKIAQNGKWDSGIDYGQKGYISDGQDNDNDFDSYVRYAGALNGDNCNISLIDEEEISEEGKCDITIRFNGTTKEIDVICKLNDSPAEFIFKGSAAKLEEKFVWKLATDGSLQSNNGSGIKPTVYDTVRDITTSFGFTSGNGIDWYVDDARNDQSGFKKYFANNQGFDLNYSVENVDVEGNFKEEIIHITKEKESMVYKCTNFMPGKQWLKVTASEDISTTSMRTRVKAASGSVATPDTPSGSSAVASNSAETLDTPQKAAKTPQQSGTSPNAPPEEGDTVDSADTPDILNALSETTEPVRIVGSRNIRLIPTIYLEAGNDAEIRVLKSKRDTTGDATKNIVTYDNINKYDDGSATESNFKGLLTDDSVPKVFSYYNFALTAAYLTTDVNALARYGIYNGQTIQGYEDIKDEASNSYNRYNYLLEPYETYFSTAEKKYFAMSSVFAQSESYTDEGNYYYSTKDSNAQQGNTNLIIGKLTPQALIGNSVGSTDTGTNISQTIVKVFKVTHNSDGSSSTSNVYMFTTNAENEAVPNNNYLKWTGQKKFESSDEGQYIVRFYWALSDGRYCTDYKTVTVTPNIPEISKTVDVKYIDGANPTKELTYTVTYKNRVEGDFSVYDVLPYNNDVRGGSDPSKISEASFTLKNIQVDSSCDEGVSVTGINSYYSTQSVSMNNDGTGFAGDEPPWSSAAGNVANVTAIKVNGTQTGQGTSTITITYTLVVNNAVIGDSYCNNAFFKVSDRVSTAQNIANSVEDYSTAVKTVIVGRDLSGYVWLDLNYNGIFDEGEPTISGVTVELLKKNDEAKYVSAGQKSQTTGEDGYYDFTAIYSEDEEDYKDYRVQFSVLNDDSVVTVHYYDGKPDESIKFNDLYPSRQLVNYYVANKSKSRNVASYDGQYFAEHSQKRYYINETLPTMEQIYIGNGLSTHANGKVVDYQYTRPYQNLALSTTPLSNSITIHKTDEDGNSLAGVEFKIEREVINGSYEVVFNGSGEETFKTDENGNILVEQLPDANYRITEVGVPDGYNMLTNSIELELPYNSAAENALSFVELTADGNVTEDGGKWCDITINVVNTKKTNLPTTGADGKFVAVFIGVAVAIAGAGILIFRHNGKKKVQ